MNFKHIIKNKFNLWSINHKIKKDQNFYDNMLSNNDGKITEVIFNKKSLSWLTVIVTLLLQLISLSTTYNGSIVYFGGVELPFNLNAPLFFALAIQLIVFCVSHTLRTNFKKSLIIVLLMATTCSMYFSYIGIYNYINSPISYLEERYNKIYTNLSDKYETAKENNKGTMTKTILNLINSANTEYSTLKMKFDNNNNLSKQLAEINVDDTSINSQTSTVTMPDISSYGNNIEKYYEDMAIYNATIGNMITDSTKQESTLKNELYNSKVKAILGEKTLDEFNKEVIDIQTKKDQLEKGIKSIYNLIISENPVDNFTDQLSSIQDYCQNYIQGISGESDVFYNILVSLNSQINSITNLQSSENLQNKINNFLIINKKDATIMKSLYDLKKIVYKESTGNVAPKEINLTEKNAMRLHSLIDSEIKGATYTLNQILNKEDLIDENSKDFSIQNLYVMPLTNLIETNSNRSIAWFCLLFAILVDGLTLVFSIMEGKDRALLFAKSTKEIISNKESLENIIMLSLLSGDTTSKDEERIESTLFKLEKFIKNFNLIPDGIENGYSMYCPINKLSDYQVFLATLCQFNLATLVDSSEILLNKSIENSNETYILIKSKFVIWVNDKIVSLTLNNQYINNLNTSTENLLMNGEL